MGRDIFVDTPGKMVESDAKHFIRGILKMFTREDDIVLDPSIGSGSTAVACIQLNRKFIGFEIEESYRKLAQKRLANLLTAKHIIREGYFLMRGKKNEKTS